MANTQRDLATLLANIDITGSGLTSGQDVRDAIVSALGGYGAIYVNGGATAQTGITATPAKVTGFATNGVSSGVNPDHTTDNLTVLVAGDYMVDANISFSGSVSSTFHLEIYNNAVASGYASDRKLNAGGDVGSTSICGVITLAVNDAVSVYVSSPDGGTSITPISANLTVKRVS